MIELYAENKDNQIRETPKNQDLTSNSLTNFICSPVEQNDSRVDTDLLVAGLRPKPWTHKLEKVFMFQRQQNSKADLFNKQRLSIWQMILDI